MAPQLIQYTVPVLGARTECDAEAVSGCERVLRPRLKARTARTTAPRTRRTHKFWESMSEIDDPVCSETAVRVCVAVMETT